MSPRRTLLLAISPAILVLVCSSGTATTIAAGVEYDVYNLPHPNVAHVVSIDLSYPEYKLKLGFSQKKRNYTSREATSTIFWRYDNPPAHDAIAAVNASFFEWTGIGITGALGSSNNYIQLPTNSWETYAFWDSRDSIILRNVTSGGTQLTFASGGTMAVDRLNYTRGSDELACYTVDWDSSTRTTVQGTEVIVSGVSYPMRPDKEVSGIVTAVRTGASSVNNAIPAGGLVLSASGTKATTLASNVSVGDRIKVRGDISPGTYYNNARLIVTGAGWLVKNGSPNTSEWGHWSDSFANSRHPRTAIAWNSTHLFLAAVDGRQGFSVGMTFAELADFLISIGATDAMNLDGGGSTTMVVNGAVVNSPSGGAERAVPNAVILVQEDTATAFPLEDNFAPSGRALPWDDKFTYNGVSSFSPTAPGGDGYVMTVMDPAGGGETSHVGDPADTDYAVEAYVYCEYRPGVASNGYERYGIFARDNGNCAFTLSTYGGGHCYSMTYDSDDGRLRAAKLVNGTLTDFPQSTPLHYPSTAWRKMRIEAVGPNIRYYLNDSLIANVLDTTFSRGYSGIGFREYFTTNSNMHGARVDNFWTYALDAPPPIGQIKQSPVGASVYLNNVVVTAALASPGMFYVQDGSAGIGVQKNAAVPTMPTVGQRVALIGQTAYAPAPYSYELIVVPSQYVVLDGTSEVTPKAMNNRATGGGEFGSQPGVADDVGAVPPRMAAGLNNVGTLVTVWGELTSGGAPGEQFCWIDDGSGLNDGTGWGIRVDLSELGNTLPGGAGYYIVTGILRCGTSAGPEALPIRVLWPRAGADVIPVP